MLLKKDGKITDNKKETDENTDESLVLLRKIEKTGRYRLYVNIATAVILSGCLIVFSVIASKMNTINETIEDASDSLVRQFNSFSMEVTESLDNLDALEDFDKKLNLDGLNSAVEDLKEAVKPLKNMVKFFK